MPRVICTIYPTGSFHGVEFREEVVDGRYVGVGETDDETALAAFRRRSGFIVDEPAPEPKSEPDKPLEDRTVEELRAFAVEHEIDLGGATKKADIVAAILAATDGPDDGGDPE